MSYIVTLLHAHPILFGVAIGIFGLLIFYLLNSSSNDDEKQPKGKQEAKKPLRTISRKEVSQHADLKDLWIIINNHVYDVTKFAPIHPGADSIANHAGGEATLGFLGDQHPERAFFDVYDHIIGTLPENEHTKWFDADEVNKHTKQGDCWIVMDKAVYNVTLWLDQHPGGAAVLLKNSGAKNDATEAFKQAHQGREDIQAMANEYFIGYMVKKPEERMKELEQALSDMRDGKNKENKENTTKQGRYVMPDELQRHHTARDAYICIDGKVYEITEFLKKGHPGGPIIEDHLGQDASKAFHAVKHKPYVLEKVLPKYYYGEMRTKYDD